MALSKLGRSFSELIESNKEDTSDESMQVPIDQIVTNPNQPRRKFDETAILELSRSIQSHGLLQPLVVVKKPGHYELVAGERRLRALKALEWKSVPVRLIEVDESGSLQVALIENIQREDLNAIENARAFRELITRFGLTQQQLAQQLGKDRSTIANTLRLLELPEKIQLMVVDGRLSQGHARALLTCSTTHDMEVFAEKIIKEGLSVRDIETLVQGKEAATATQKNIPNPNIIHVEKELTSALQTKVTIKDKGKNKGAIVIQYYDLNDFDRIKSILTRS